MCVRLTHSRVPVRTEVELREWLDRLDRVLKPSIQDSDDPAHGMNRNALVTLLRTQVRFLATDPARWQHAKRAVHAYVTGRVATAVKSLAAACRLA